MRSTGVANGMRGSRSGGGLQGQRGMSMIEVLVAIVVLAIGLLGLAGLQANGIKVTQGATLRWKASALAADLADRMRADKTDFLAMTPAAQCTIAAGATAVGPNCPPGFAGALLVDWAGTQLTAMPLGVATLTLLATNDLEVDLMWNDTRAATYASNNATGGGGYTAMAVTGGLCGASTMTTGSVCTKVVTRLL